MTVEPLIEASEGGEGKRTRILAAALALFAQYGFRRTTIDEIATAAEVAKGTVYLYFDTKDSIFRALSEDLAGRVLSDAAAAFARTDGGFDDNLYWALDAKFGRFFRLVRSSRHAAELLDSKNRLSSEIFKSFDAGYRDQIRSALAQAEQRGAIGLASAGFSAGALTELLIASSYGVELTATDAAAMAAQLRALVKLTLSALPPARRPRA